jgi:hypothetical protein
MNNSWKHISAGLLVLALVVYWLFWGRILVIDARGKSLDAVVDLSYFEGLHPHMTRTEISNKMGQPTNIDVPYEDKSENYVEIRWMYKRPSGSLNYYVEQTDTPGGTPEYIPNDLGLDGFLRGTPKSLIGRTFVEIHDGTNRLVIRLKGNKKIKAINWYAPRKRQKEKSS